VPEAYELHDGRFILDKTFTSAANAVVVDGASFPGGRVPEGKVWTILSGSYNPSALETRTVFWLILSRGSNLFPITQPVAIALSGSILLPLLTMGMEIKLFPGEWLRVTRDAATAGSTMTMILRIIESDLPFYSHEEPLKKIVKQAQRRGSVYRSSGGISIGGGMPGGGHGGEGGGGGGGAEPY